ncbi:MAG: tryptophan synthase subunit alpha [Rickettsiales bacterium]|nr:tryptophan synthase subunit alpha [Rickettsiales bacterium]
MSNRISQCFSELKKSGQKALITYVMANDPDQVTTLEILQTLAESGADIIELGLPFSDPMADGPAIQEAANRALRSGGSTERTLEIVKEFRQNNTTTPIVLMGYYNPIYRYGVEKFVSDAVVSGVDGIIIVDLPPEEAEEFTQYSNPAGLDFIRLTTPTTDTKRAEVVLSDTTGFVYYISVAGVTGTRSASTDSITKAVKNLRKLTKLPICAGFGIKTPEQAAAIAPCVDGVVVGSAIIEYVKQRATPDVSIMSQLSAFVKSLKQAINSQL